MNEQNITTFAFEGNPVRIMGEDGDPWFVLADVCKVLEIAESHRAAARLDDDEKARHTVTTPGGDQEMTIINESGLYSLILTSRKPAAKRFKKWVTAEVLPSIRKTGGYGVSAVDLENPAWLRCALLEYTEKVLTLEAEANENRPLVEGYRRIAVASDGSMCLTDAAKAVRMRPKDFIAHLSEKKWIYRRAGNGHWVGYQDKVQAGYLEHKVTEVYRTDGTTKITEQVRVLAKGLAKVAHDMGLDLVA
jgi:prophage antirepressor-like protein